MVLILKKGATKEEMAALEAKLQKRNRKKGVDTRKYCGILKLEEDPLVIQKKLRDEWE